MGTNRRRRSLATRRRLAQRWLDSGLTQQRFADEHGVAASSLARWVAELRQRDVAPAAPAGFLDVTPAEASAKSVRLTLGAVTLELDQLPPVEYVLALGAASC